MSTRSKSRRKLRAFGENPRGFSSVIGAIFAVLIMISVATSVFMWTLSDNTNYNDAARQRNQMEADRLSENVVAANANITFSTNQVAVTAELTNLGSTTASVVNLWVTDATISVYNNASTSINIVLRPGDKTVVSRVVNIQGVSPLDTVSGYFVTARGNVVPLEREGRITVAQLAQGIGSLALDFYTFRYFTYETSPSNKLKNYPAGNQSFAIPHGEYIAFGVVLTNLDPSFQTVTFDNRSQVWLFCPEALGATVAEPTVWYIVKEDPESGIIQAAYSEISIGHGETKLVIFASTTVGYFSKVSLTKADYKNKLFAVNLMLHGKLGTRDYGQNIPFVSLYCHA